MKIIDSDMQKQFMNDGFYVFRNMLEPELIDTLRGITDEVLAQQEEAHFEQQRAPGSMVMIDWEMAYRYDVLAELIAHPKMLKGLAQLGFAEPKFGHGQHHQQAAAQPATVLARGRQVLGRSGQLYAAAYPVFSDVLSRGHRAGERLLEGDSGIASEAPRAA